MTKTGEVIESTMSEVAEWMSRIDRVELLASGVEILLDVKIVFTGPTLGVSLPTEVLKVLGRCDLLLDLDIYHND